MKKAILVVSFGTSYPETKRKKRLKPVKKKSGPRVPRLQRVSCIHIQ